MDLYEKHSEERRRFQYHLQRVGALIPISFEVFKKSDKEQLLTAKYAWKRNGKPMNQTIRLSSV